MRILEILVFVIALAIFVPLFIFWPFILDHVDVFLAVLTMVLVVWTIGIFIWLEFFDEK